MAHNAMQNNGQRRVAFMNQKGGVGKTTSSVNLAAAWARAGWRTLVVDLDPQAHATLHLGGDPDASEGGVEPVLLALNDELDAVAHASVHDRSERLGVLGASTDLAAAEHDLAGAQERHHRLAAGLDRLADRFDLVVIDCPPSLGLLTLNGLAAAHEVIIPMQSHFLALQGVGKLLETVNAVAGQVNPSLAVAGVILCAHEEQSRHSREVVEDMTRFFEASGEAPSPWQHAQVFRPAIRRNIKLAECPSFGQTVFEYDETCAGAQDYEKLAAVIAERWAEPGTRDDAPTEAAGQTAEPKPAEPVSAPAP